MSYVAHYQRSCDRKNISPLEGCLSCGGILQDDALIYWLCSSDYTDVADT